MKRMETLNKKVKIDVIVIDPETNETVDARSIEVWGNPGYELEMYVNYNAVHTQILKEEG